MEIGSQPVRRRRTPPSPDGAPVLPSRGFVARGPEPRDRAARRGLAAHDPVGLALAARPPRRRARLLPRPRRPHRRLYARARGPGPAGGGSALPPLLRGPRGRPGRRLRAARRRRLRAPGGRVGRRARRGGGGRCRRPPPPPPHAHQRGGRAGRPGCPGRRALPRDGAADAGGDRGRRAVAARRRVGGADARLGRTLRAGHSPVGHPDRARRAAPRRRPGALHHGRQRLRPRPLPPARGRPGGALGPPPGRGPPGLAAGGGGGQRGLRGGGPGRLRRRADAAVRRALHGGQAGGAADRGLRARPHGVRASRAAGDRGRLPRRVGGRAPRRRDRAHGGGGRVPGGLAWPRRAPGVPQRLRRRGAALRARAVRAGARRGHGVRAPRDRGRRLRPRGDRRRRRDGLAGGARRRARARACAGGRRQPAHRAPPPRRAGPRGGARALFLARAGAGGRRSLRVRTLRSVGPIGTAVHIHAPEPLLPFRAPPQGREPAHREHAMHRRTARPTQPVGLYDPSYEHDACGVAMVARLGGTACHETVQRAVAALENLEHRGAAGADPNTGDGAGMLLQLPDELLRGVIRADLPPPGRYGVAVCFLPQEEERRAELEALLTRTVEAEGQRVVGWRDVPVDKDYVGITANFFAPYIKHLVVAAATPDCLEDQDAFERRLYVIRRVAELAAGPDLVVPSFSSRTIVYKGMLTAPQLLGYYPDLQDPRTRTALALVHSRFSTNTFPSWELAHPYRYIAHNGEINTLRGNVNWMRARESQLASDLFGEDGLAKLLPIVRPGGSDSATFDNVLELLVLAGRSLPHAVMMMIPEAYSGRDDLPDHLKGFYAFHSCLMEPWDGPAAVAFTDGRVIGATLDRNGLRPGRWLETKDGWVVLGSETGVMPIREADIEVKGRLHPGRLFMADLQSGRLEADRQAERRVAGRRPYGDWYREGVVHLADLPDRDPRVARTEPLRMRQLAFGYTQEDLRVLLTPTAARGEEPIGSMGNDLALAVLSDRQPPLFSYFKQLFAQVTNPPIDPIRESVVMSVASGVGS